MIWTQAIKKLLLAVQTSSNEGLRLNSVDGVGKCEQKRRGTNEKTQ